MCEEQYHSASHCKYLTQYHVIWYFKFSVLQDDIDVALKKIIVKICDQYNYNIKALDIMSDYIHVFVDCPHTVAPSDIVRTLKSLSAIELIKLFPRLKQFYVCYGMLWSRGYFISSLDHISEATIKNYVEDQKNADK